MPDSYLIGLKEKFYTKEVCFGRKFFLLSVELLSAIGEVIILRAFLLFLATLLCFYSTRFLVLKTFSKAHIFVFSAVDKHTMSSIPYCLYF